MPREIVSPVTSAATAAFTPQGLFKRGDDVPPAGNTEISKFLRPEWQQPRQLAAPPDIGLRIAR